MNTLTTAVPATNWHFDDYPYFKVCGEITTSPDIQTFGLNCRFCPGICLQLDEFQQHLKEFHLNNINEMYALKLDESLKETELQMQLEQLTALNHKQQQNGNTSLMTTTSTRPVFDDVDLLFGGGIKKCSTDMSSAVDKTKECELTKNSTTTLPLTNVISTSLLDNVNDNHLDISMCLPSLESSLESTHMDLVYIMESALPSELLSTPIKKAATAAKPPPPPAPAPPTLSTISSNSLADPLAIPSTTITSTADHCMPTTTMTNVTSENSSTYVNAIAAEPEPESMATEEEEINEQISEETALPEESLPDQLEEEENEDEEKVVVKRKTQNTLSTELRKLEKNREFVSYLIEAYKNKPKLWNPHHSEYQYNARRSTYNELCAAVKRDWNFELTGNEIYTLIKTLRGRFCRELAKPNVDTKKKRLWYFNKMIYLRDIIDNKRAERESKYDDTASEQSLESSNSSSDSSKHNPQHERLTLLLQCYEAEESLWNPQHFAYSDYDKKPCYEQISATLSREYNIQLTADDCMREMQKLLIRYRKELRIMLQHKGLYLPKLWCYEQMEFLKPIYTELILKRIDKKKGIVECNRRSNFLKASPICLESLDEQYQFIEIYRNYPALWNVDHPDYRSSSFREKACSEMLEELNVTLNLDATLDELQRTLLDLRKEYSVEKLKKLSNSACSMSLLHKKLSEFLDDYIGPFRCNDCHELIKTADQFKIHKSSHDGIQPFICTLCGKGFQLPGNLTVHIRRHKQDFPYTCEKCHKSFATSTEVIVHMRSHTGERPYICDYCGKSFKTWSFFDIHRRIHLNQSTFHCPICEKGFYEKNRYTDHMNGHLNIRKHLCNVCGKSFTTYGNLKKHNELHLPIKKYKCKLCSKRFAQFASLRWHKLRQHFEVLCENEQ